MIRRWEEADSGKKRNGWKLVLLAILTMASLFVLVSDLGRVLKIMGLRPAESYSEASIHAERRLASRLNPAQRTLMFGDFSIADQVGRKEALWKIQPEDPAFYAEYVAAFNERGKGLPGGFLPTARQIDPENAWFTYCAAAEGVLSCVTKKPQKSTRVGRKLIPGGPPSWEIHDGIRLDRAIGFLGEARGQSKCENYAASMMRRRLPLLSQGSLEEYSDSMYYLSMNTTSLTPQLRGVAVAIAAKGWQMAGNSDLEGFQELNANADRFLKDISGVDVGVLIDEYCILNCASTIAASLGPAASVLGLHEEAEHWKDIEERVRDLLGSSSSGEIRIDNKDYQRGVKTGILTGYYLEAWPQNSSNPPQLKDADVKPLRMVDHEIASRLCCYAAWGILVVMIGILSVFRFSATVMIRQLARRMELLLTAKDWVWVMGLGLVSPLLYVMAINRSTPLGGRDYGLAGTFLLLPAAQFLGLLMLWLLSSVWAIRWRLGIRAAVFQLGKRNAIFSAMPLLLVAAFIPVVGWAATTGSVPEIWIEEWDWSAIHIAGRESEARLWIAFGLLALVIGWMLAGVGIASFGEATKRLQSATILLALIPVCAAGMLLLAAMTPLFKSAEHDWFCQDRLMKFDSSCPGSSRYEYHIATAMRKELREILGYGS